MECKLKGTVCCPLLSLNPPKVNKSLKNPKLRVQHTFFFTCMHLGTLSLFKAFADQYVRHVHNIGLFCSVNLTQEVI